MPTGIRLKHKDRNNPVTKTRLTQLAYGEFQVPFTRIFVTNDGFKAICKDDQDADKILSREVRNKFNDEGLIVIMPPELKARRSVFVRQVDSDVGKHTAEELKQDIELRNARLKISEVVKIKDYTHVFKISFEETSMADEVIMNGFLTYNMSITSGQISREKFVSLLTCFTCYKYEEHSTKDCPEKGKKYCSNCAAEGHTFNECNNPSAGCLNCKRNGDEYQNHRTLAMACPIKKLLINYKTEEEKKKEKDKQQTTYVEIAKRAVQEVSKPKVDTVLNLSEALHHKVMISMIHAHINNIINPGSYADELNTMLEKNNLPRMWFPPNPDSKNLLYATSTPELTQLYQEGEQVGAASMPIIFPTAEEEEEERKMDQELQQQQLQQQYQQQQQTQSQQQRDPRKARRKSQPDQSVRPKTSQIEIEDVEALSKAVPQQQQIITAKDIGLKIMITSKQEFPTTKVTGRNIYRNCEEGKYKWQYLDKRFKEEYIWTLIIKEKLKITPNEFKLVEESEFRRIRNGLLQERSPPGYQQMQKIKK